MINGVLVENGERNTRLRVKTGGAHILRLRDALRPEEATTPLKRAYYIAQLAVAGQLPNGEAAAILKGALQSAPEFFAGFDIHDSVETHDFYQVMRSLRESVFSDRSPAARNGCASAAAAAAS